MDIHLPFIKILVFQKTERGSKSLNPIPVVLVGDITLLTQTVFEMYLPQEQKKYELITAVNVVEKNL